MSTRTAARHRRPVRARTPLRAIGDAVATNATTVSRRSAVIAASSGLIVTMGLPAVASPLLGTGDAAPEAATRSQPAVPAAGAPLTARPGAAQDPGAGPADAATLRGEAADAAAATAQRAGDALRASRAAALQRTAASEAAARQAAEAISARRATTLSRDADRTASDAPSAASSAPSSAASSTAAPTSGSAVVDVAKRYFGITYRYGGTTPAGFDCSGFVKYVYAQVGVDLPRTSGEQAQHGTRVSRSHARPGDIVSFVGAGGVYHNGIYIGGGQMIDSPRTGQAIAVHDIWSSSVVFTHVGS